MKRIFIIGGFVLGILFGVVFGGWLAMKILAQRSGELAINPRNFSMPVENKESSPNQIQEIRQSIVPVVRAAAGARWINPERALGNAIALTGDGLLAMSMPLKSVAGVRAVLSEGAARELQFAKDSQGKNLKSPGGGVTFLMPDKIVADKLPNLRAVTFGDFGDLVIGQAVFVIDRAGRLMTSRITELKMTPEADQPLFSEYFGGFAQLESQMEEGAWVFSGNGELLGSIQKDGRMLPAEFIANMLRIYLGGQKTASATLGVFVLDLSRLLILQDGPRKGLLIVGDGVHPGVSFGGAADKAGFKVGDILISFDHEPLSGGLPLPLLLQHYRPGTEVEVVFLRDHQERKVKVVLGGL